MVAVDWNVPEAAIVGAAVLELFLCFASAAERRGQTGTALSIYGGIDNARQ
jgi:hypothetical protein